jgi:transcription-repair coupling factor (superfamily II helicase)
MPVTIGYLNRFRTAKQKSRNYKRFSGGKTRYRYWHQLVNKKCSFKDLGLLIVDEESLELM